MADILGCCRLPACDQLLIVDCCFAANAFGKEHVGKRKCEMIVSSGCENKVPAPRHEGSFTRTLHQALKKLLAENKGGFVTSKLYREIFHTTSHPVKPWLFDQSRQDYGRIWLRPQIPTTQEAPKSENGETFLNLTLRLSEEPEGFVMNQLATHLQYLPHVAQIRVEKLYAPKKQIENFMQLVIQAQKLRPLIRKIHARRKRKQLMSLPPSERYLKFLKLRMDSKELSAFDWSSALDNHNPTLVTPSSPLRHRRTKSITWPPTQAEASPTTKSLSNRLFSLDYKVTLPGYSSIPRFFPYRTNTMTSLSMAPAGKSFVAPTSQLTNQDNIAASHLESDEMPSLSATRTWWHLVGEDNLWHGAMWFALCYVVFCLCHQVME